MFMFDDYLSVVSLFWEHLNIGSIQFQASFSYYD